MYDVARHVDSSVNMFEEWGLPFWYDDEGLYVREGRWQVMIHGEAYKPIVAEATKKAIGPDNHFERVFISHLFTDADDPNRIAGAVGFGVREDVIYVFKARICDQRGRRRDGPVPAPQRGRGYGAHLVLHLRQPASVYGLVIPVGAEMTQMEQPFRAPAASRTPTGRWAHGPSCPAPT